MARHSYMSMALATSLEEHEMWAKKLWTRMDRKKSDIITAEELNCDEFFQIIRYILAPQVADSGVASYGRSEVNALQTVTYCMKKADKNEQGFLTFKEFEAFLLELRGAIHKDKEVVAELVFALFDYNGDLWLEESEFREAFRYFVGHRPTEDEFHKQWTVLDLKRVGRVRVPEYALWLRTAASAEFRRYAPAVLGALKHSPSARKKSSPAAPLPFRPAPGVVPPYADQLPELIPLWNERWGTKDPSEQNAAFRGNKRMKTWFSRPQSLPELKRFYETYDGFSSNRRRLALPEDPVPKVVLSTDSVMSLSAPGASRHVSGGSMRNSRGEVVPWRENTPRALRKVVWEPGSLLLRVPGAPPPHLYLGRDAPPE